MKRNFLCLIISCLFPLSISLYSQKFVEKDLFISPVDFKLVLAGNFGELRSSHFHSGIDIKTNSISGEKIYAVADGWVSRIKVASNGYGNAIYINHPSGYVSQYGHLDKFENKIAEFVKTIQYSRKSFSVDIFPERTQLIIKQGDLIGYSGNSGDSEGVHLHFEIRDAGNGRVLNPLNYYSEIKDSINPKIYRLAVFPLGKKRIDLNGSYSSLHELSKWQGKYYIKSKEIIKVGGYFGLGIETLDFMNDTWNNFGVYSIELLMDNQLVYIHEINDFSFNESRYLNSFIDYKSWQEGVKIQKSFLEPNNKLSIYKFSKNKGRIKLEDNNLHAAKYIVKDIYGNTSVLGFLIQNDSTGWNLNKEDFPLENVKKYMTWSDTNSFENDEIKIVIPSGALYDSILFTYRFEEKPDSLYSSIHYVHNLNTPLHKYYSMSIKPIKLPENLKTKALIAGINNEGEIWPVGGEWKEAFINVRTRDFGPYFVAVDTIPPEISLFDEESEEIKDNNSVISFIIKDDLSGIRKYEGKIDGKWALFEYDEKNDLLSYTFDAERLITETEHNILLTVSDKKGNVSVYEGSFIY